MINEKEFYVLTTAESSEQPLSQRNFARKTENKHEISIIAALNMC